MNPTHSLLLAAGVVLSASATSADVLVSQPANSNWTRIESLVSSSPAQNLEAADDFEAHGWIQRVLAVGDDCFSCAPPSVAGVRVRFYAWTADGPGALQHDVFVPAGSPDLVYDPNGPTDLDVTLPVPFHATGKHFLSVQIAFEGGGYWGFWMSNQNAPNGSPLRWRDLADGPAWGDYMDVLNHPVISDLAFVIYGTPDDDPGGSDACARWTVDDMPLPSPSDHGILRALVRLDDGTAWAAGDHSAPVLGGIDRFTMLRHWDGSSWTAVPSPSPTPAVGLTYCELWGVHASGPDDAWAVGNKNDLDGGEVYVGTHCLALHWDGSSWNERPVPLPGGGSSIFQQAAGDRILDVVAIAPDDAWFVGQWFVFLPSDAVVWPGLMMHWDGSDYTVIADPFHDALDETLVSIDASGADDVWAVGTNYQWPGYTGVAYHYDGSSWSRVVLPPVGLMHRCSAVEVIAPDDVWIAGQSLDWQTMQWVPMMLHWDGSSWSETPVPAHVGDFAAVSSDEVYGLGASIVRWDGTAWSVVDFPGLEDVPDAGFTAIAPVAPCTLLGAGRRSIAGNLMPMGAHLEPNLPANPFDLDGDGAVGFGDLVVVLGAWGPCGAPCDADFDANGTVDFDDLLLLLGQWG